MVYFSIVETISFPFFFFIVSEGIATLKEVAGSMRSELPEDKESIPSSRQVRGWRILVQLYSYCTTTIVQWTPAEMWLPL